MKEIMSDWENEDWTYSAKRIVSWVKALDPDQPVMLLIRHSHRDVLKDQKDMLGGGITELGRELSIEMGRQLPKSREAYFFFSIVPRCYETAEAMAQGFSENGGEVIDMDTLPTLVRPEYTLDEVWNNLQPNGENVTEFVNRWAAGELEGIEPFSEFQERLMDDTLRRFCSLQESIMHIHVTHDLSLMAAKRMLFDRPLEWEDRESFLGGLAMTLRKGEPSLYVSGIEELVSSALLKTKVS